MSEFKSYHVTVIEWLSHTVVIKATCDADAEEQARHLWEHKEEGSFSFRDSGIDGITVEEVQP